MKKKSELPTQTLKCLVNLWDDTQRLRLANENRLRKASEGEMYISEPDKRAIEETIEELRGAEKRACDRMKRLVAAHPMYRWLSDQRGISEVLAACLLSQFDITKAARPSSFWKFAGMHVEDGHAPHPEKGATLPYNAWLKMKVHLLAESFIKSNNEHYRAIYDGYKHRCQCMGTCRKTVEEHAGRKSEATWFPSDTKGKPKPGDFCTKLHMHNKSLRAMVKVFLLDFWLEWRKVAGLPIVPSYAEGKLGMRHGEDSA